MFTLVFGGPGCATPCAKTALARTAVTVIKTRGCQASLRQLPLSVQRARLPSGAPNTTNPTHIKPNQELALEQASKKAAEWFNGPDSSLSGLPPPKPHVGISGPSQAMVRQDLGCRVWRGLPRLPGRGQRYRGHVSPTPPLPLATAWVVSAT